MPRHLAPCHQGAFDSLCGLHAIINALQVLVPSMTAKEAHRLFRMLMKEIVRKDVFKVVWRGMDGVLFRQLLVDAIEATARKHGIGIEVMRPFGGMPVEFADVIQTLGQTLDQRCVAVTMIHARVWHWTVITKATKKSILLFDSSGLSLVRMKNCGLRNTDSRYRINARELLFLRRAERE